MEVFENLVTLSLQIEARRRSTRRRRTPAPSAPATPTPRCATPSSLPLHMSAHNDARGSVHNVAVKVFIMMQGVELLDWYS